MLLSRLTRAFSSSTPKKVAGLTSKRSRPLAIVGAFGITGGLSYYAFYYRPQQLNKRELSLDHFTRYRITYKEDVDDVHFLLELTPLAKQRVNLWSKMGCENLWSVQIKQPDIMVVRNYTPLPLQFNQDTQQLEVFEDGEFAGGKLFFYIKHYEQGEVARWLHGLRYNHIVELRGPYIDYEFPHYEGEICRERSFLKVGNKGPAAPDKFKNQPFDIAMFTAGTGVVTALQLLLTENPFRGVIDLFYSCKSFDELGPLGSIVRALERNGRLSLHISESSREPRTEKRLQEMLKRVSKPFKYCGPVPYEETASGDPKPVLSLVCGPEGYIAAISGPKFDPAQGPIGGLLKRRQWDSENVYKLS